MKFPVVFTALSIALVGFNSANAGNLSGTYSLRFTSICQSLQKQVFTTVGKGTTDQDQQSQIQTFDNGGITQLAGFITLTPLKPGAQTGTVTATVTQTNGSLAVLGLNGANPTPDVSIGTKTVTGAYSLSSGTGTNPGSFTLSLSGKNPNVYSAYVSKLGAFGILGHMDFIRTEANGNSGPSCSDLGSIDLF